MSFKPTKSQEIALKQIKDFIRKPIGNNFNERVLVLFGPAGSGKTTLIYHALEDLIKEDLGLEKYDEDDFFSNFGYNIPNVMGVTVSHKAKLRLQESIPNASTYAGYFGMKPVYGNDGTIKFEKIKKNPMSNKVFPHELPFQVVVHDEVSMYGMDSVNFIEQYTNSNSKIILMGDRYQLSPIIEDLTIANDLDSPVFTLFKNKVELVERVRQTVGNPILDLSDEIKKEIDGDKNIDRILALIHKEDRFSDGVGYRTIKKTSLIKDYIEAYKKDSETRVICYRNKQINMINSTIRKKLFSDAQHSFVVDDAIYMNLTFTNEFERSFYNSEEFKIIGMQPNVKVQGVDCYLATVKDELGGSIILVSENGLPVYNKTLADLQRTAKQADYKTRGKKWETFFKFRDSFADVSYGYAFTAYKAQGSGFTNVYVDLDDILTTPISNKRKLQTLYTAITRATHQVIFF